MSDIQKANGKAMPIQPLPSTKGPSLWRAGALLLLLSAIFWLFRDAALATYQAWQTEEYSHGYLVPLIALWLLLNKMEEHKVNATASWAGAIILTLCIVASFLFQLAGISGLQPQLLIVTLLALYLMLYGPKASWQCIAPLGFLLFAAPLPKFFYYTMSFNMQMMSTSLGAGMLEIVGVSVFQDGNVIDLGGYQLQVIEACNGLRYLFPLMALGYMLAMMYRASMFKRAVLFLSTIPITIFMNSLRIALIGVTVNEWGQEMAEGLIHDIEGWVVFAGCAAVLLLEIRLMQAIGRRGEMDYDLLRLPAIFKSPAPAISSAPAKAISLVLLLGLAAQALSGLALKDYIKPVPLAQPMSAFPMQLGDWTGRMGRLDEKALKVLGTEDYLLADYTNAKTNAPPVNLYILYYPKQDSTSNQAVHSPSVCIPGGGWTIEAQGTEFLSLTPSAASGAQTLPKQTRALTVNRLLISKEGKRQLVYYWFIQNGENFADANLSRLAVIKNAIRYGRTNGAMVRVTTDIPAGEDETEAKERLGEALNQMLYGMKTIL